MNNQMLPMQLIQFVKGSKNPSEVIINMMQERVGENPFYTNLLSLARNNQGPEIENIVKNMFAERGLDFEKEFNSFRNIVGL